MKKDPVRFINTIAPFIQEAAERNKYNFPSIIIAQACLESGYGTSKLAKYHNYFGLKCGSKWKGKSVNIETNEEYTPGEITRIRDYFRVYDSLEEGIQGYFDYFKSYKKYDVLTSAISQEDYINLIKNLGYATDSKYVEKVLKIVRQYNLDDFNPKDYIEYKVRRQDTLWSIARELLGVGPRYVEIKALNNLVNNCIHVNQILKVPKR